MGNLKTYTPGTYKDSEELTGLKQQANYWNGQNFVDFQYADFADSDRTNQFLSQHNNLKEPDPFAFSKQQNWDNNTYKLENMKDFSYDVNGDALYQQYKDQYTNQGKMAMMDTMGQASAMTGGYGNSYAQSVGQQAYQGYLQQLTDKIPELYQLALSKYNSDRDNLYKMNDLYQNLYNNEYGRHRDAVDDYHNDRSHLANMWSISHDMDVDSYTANRDTDLAENESHNKNIKDNRDNFNGLVSDFANREWNQYTDREKINQTAIDMYNSNQQWKDEFDEKVRMNNQSINQWQSEFDEMVRMNNQSINQWQSEFDEMVRTNNATIKTNAQKTAADNCYAAIESGVMPSDDMIKAAGLDKTTVKNMVDKRNVQDDSNGDFQRYTYAGVDADGNSRFYRDGKEYTVEKGTNPYTGTTNPDAKNGTFSNGYQPDNIGGKKLQKSGYTCEVNGVTQNVWKIKNSGRSGDVSYYAWDGTKNMYEEIPKEAFN